MVDIAENELDGGSDHHTNMFYVIEFACATGGLKKGR